MLSKRKREWDEGFDTETFDRLLKLAERHDNYFVYKDSRAYERSVNDFIAHYRGKGWNDRWKVYGRHERLGAYAFDTAHPGTVWKAFIVRVGGRWRYTGTAYTIEGEGMLEEVPTMAQLAHDFGVTPDDVWYQFEDVYSLGRLRKTSA